MAQRSKPAKPSKPSKPSKPAVRSTIPKKPSGQPALRKRRTK